MILDENYRILTDESNVILQFHEIRLRNKKDLSTEKYEFLDNFYYPTIKHALKAYLNKSLKEQYDFQSVIDKIEEVELKIDTLCRKV